jgi:hypothetical protein
MTREWIERWHGSGPDRGWAIWETNNGNRIAYVGEGEHSERLTSVIVAAHNAALAAPSADRAAAPVGQPAAQAVEVRKENGNAQ